MAASSPIQIIYMENTGKSGGTSHNKFYQIEVKYNGKEYEIHTTWGPIGLTGQHKLHSYYAERYTAMTAAESIADSKKAKGYIIREHKSTVQKMNPTTKAEPGAIQLNRFSFDED